MHVRQALFILFFPSPTLSYTVIECRLNIMYTVQYVVVTNKICYTESYQLYQNKNRVVEIKNIIEMFNTESNPDPVIFVRIQIRI